jgi:hypothetical protein
MYRKRREGKTRKKQEVLRFRSGKLKAENPAAAAGEILEEAGTDGPDKQEGGKSTTKDPPGLRIFRIYAASILKETCIPFFTLDT